MARHLVFTASFAILLLAACGIADAAKSHEGKEHEEEKGEDKSKDHDKDERKENGDGRGKARGLVPDPSAPPAREAFPETPLDHEPAPHPAAPTVAPGPLPASDVPAPPASTPALAPQNVWGAFALWTQPEAAPTFVPPRVDAPFESASIPLPDSSIGAPVPIPASNADALDARLASQGATQAPAWSSSIAAPVREAPAGDAPWWQGLVWALPLAGLGAVGAVLLLQRRSAPLALPVSKREMAPVPPCDLKGILRNGQIAAKRGSLAEAVAWFDQALRLAPRLGVALFCKGVCLAAHGRVAEAYGALRLACDEQPDEASYHVHFARVALALGKHKEAMDALELVARAIPEIAPAMLDDPQLAALRDHPRFLAMCGEL